MHALVGRASAKASALVVMSREAASCREVTKCSPVKRKRSTAPAAAYTIPSRWHTKQTSMPRPHGRRHGATLGARTDTERAAGHVP